MECDQFLGLRVIQWLQQYAIYDSENRGVRRDSNCDGQQSDNGKHGTVAKRAQPITDIEENIFHRWPCPNFATILLEQSHIPKLPPRGMYRFFLGHTIRNQFLNSLVE